MLKKFVLLIATTMFIYSGAIKADTLEEGIAEQGTLPYALLAMIQGGPKPSLTSATPSVARTPITTSM